MYPTEVAREIAARRPDLRAANAIETVLTEDPTLTADAAIAILDESTWWAWHDKDSSRWSGSTDEAEARCAAWVAGDSDDGPTRA